MLDVVIEYGIEELMDFPQLHCKLTTTTRLLCQLTHAHLVAIHVLIIRISIEVLKISLFLAVEMTFRASRPLSNC